MAAAIISLNVGGVMYQTTLSTLTKYPDSMLSNMFGGYLPSAQDSNGNYFIDRDGKMFRYVLLFLRSSKLLLPDDFQELDLLDAEADFFQILPLKDALKAYRDEKRTSYLSTLTSQQVFGLNVGGSLYTVLKKHLESDYVQPRSAYKLLAVRKKLLEIVLNPDAIRDGAGNCILEGDPLLFRYFLNFIQTGHFQVPNDFEDYHQLVIDLHRYDRNILLKDVLPHYKLKTLSSDVRESLNYLKHTLDASGP